MDNCTFWPDQLFGKDWSHCCLLHDVAYGLGVDRKQADAELYQCVLAATGWVPFAAIMFVAVSAFGWIFWKRGNRG